MFNFLGTIAEYFLDLNRERTMEGLKAALARGRKGGRRRSSASRPGGAPRHAQGPDHSRGRDRQAPRSEPPTFYTYFPPPGPGRTSEPPMRLSDLPPREQDRYLDGITVGIGTREHGRPKSDREALDPWQGGDEGWFWRRGFDAGFDGRDAAEDLARPPLLTGGPPMTTVQLRRMDPARNMAGSPS
jgi:hypothetical protein